MVLKPQDMLRFFQIQILTGIQRWTGFPISQTWWIPVGISFLTKHLYCCLSPPKLGLSLLSKNSLDGYFNQLEVYCYSRVVYVRFFVLFCFLVLLHQMITTCQGEQPFRPNVHLLTPWIPIQAFPNCKNPPLWTYFLNNLVRILEFSQLGENAIAGPGEEFFSWEVQSIHWKTLPLV